MTGTGPSFDPIQELENEVYSADPCVVGTVYSSPIRVGSRKHLALGLTYVEGSMTSMTITIEVWDGADWVALGGTTGTAWSYAMSADTTATVIVGDASNEEQPAHILWNIVRVKLVGAGTATSSSITVRAAAK